MNWKRTTIASVVLACSLLATGCAEHRRGYDPYYGHQWGVGETVYYNQWYGEAYRGREHRDYRKLKKDEQRNYWNWRNTHGDRDHDHDRDHDRH